MTPTLESEFQHLLKKELQILYPGCVILKNNSHYQQGIPDLLILWNDRWAVLECKKSSTESFRPNQEYFIDVLNEMSFASVIHPQNREEVLDALSTAFRAHR